MAEKTNNSKVITKDYLAEQFFIYHNKYIKEGIETNKQDKLIVDTKHLTWDNSNLGLKIDNDNSAKVNDYISLKNSDGTLTWKTPITNQSEIDNDNENLVTGKAVYNFEGSNNIKKVGTISEGSWDVGNIQIDDNSLKISDFTIKQEETGELSIFSEGRNLGLIADYLSLNKNLTVTDDITAKNINIESKLDTKEADIEEANIDKANIFNLIIGDSISTTENDSDINFNNNIFVNGDVKLNKNIDFSGLTFSIKTGTIELLTIKDDNISLKKNVIADNNILIKKDSTVKGVITTKSLTIEDDNFTLGGEVLAIATDAEINSFFDDWQS